MGVGGQGDRVARVTVDYVKLTMPLTKRRLKLPAPRFS
jgi:hypothetical protein